MSNLGFPTPSPCPECGWIPAHNRIDALSKKVVYRCMNTTCSNFFSAEGNNWGEALGKWDGWCANQRIKQNMLRGFLSSSYL